MLRSVVVDSSPRPAARTATTHASRIGAALVAAGSVLLGGCSADFLRFDAPVFSLDDDARSGVAAAGLGGSRSAATHSEPRTAGYAATSDVADGGISTSTVSGGAVEPVTRGAASGRATLAPRRTIVAGGGTSGGGSSRPIATTPLATGALGRPETVVVQPGDTLYQLSRQHGVSVAALREANNLSGNIIHPGQKLRLPSATAGPSRIGEVPRRAAPAGVADAVRAPAGARTVTVAAGDSLYAISRRTGVPVGELKRLNGITDVHRLRPGTVLVLGAAGGNQVAGRTDFGQRDQSGRSQPYRAPAGRSQSGLIPTKPIRTVAIGRDMSAPAANGRASAGAPRILNGAESGVAAAAWPAEPERDTSAAERDGSAASKFRWPAKGRIIATFNQGDRGAKNDGISISLPIGTPIHAVEAGTVAYAGSELKGYGNLILLRHENGWVSAYAHASELLVARGDKVERGQVIAKAGRSGGVTQPQLHFELRREAKPVDPLPHMAAM